MADKYVDLKACVRTIYEQHKGRYGYRRITEFVVKSERLKKFMVYWVADIGLWGHTIISLGVLVGVGVGVGYSRPSASVIESLASPFLTYSIFVLLVLEAVVFNPTIVSPSVGTRTQVFGLLLLLSGAADQLISALLDLNG